MGPTRELTIIGLLGRAGSGKSTVAAYLKQEYGAKVFSFATPVKLLAGELFGFNTDQLFGSQADKEATDPRYGFSPREAMVRLGSGGRTYLGENVWVDACFKMISDHSKQNPEQRLYVIEDVRFDNEARAIRQSHLIYPATGKVLKLVCPDSVSTADRNSPTEASVDQVRPNLVDHVIVCSRSDGGKTLLDAAGSIIGHWLAAPPPVVAADW